MLAAIARRFGRSGGLKPLRALLDERLAAERRPTATYVGNNRVLVGTRVGDRTIAYYVEADDRLLSPWFIVTGQFETELTNYFLRHLRPDSHCIDAGSNFGYYSCLMARYCPEGRVIGIEADRHIADLARDNLFINNLHGGADIICAAVADRCEEITLYRRASRSGNTSIVQVGANFTTALGEPPAEPFTVPGIRIDDLADRMQGKVDFIKIDVEGAEPLALAGASETIRRNRDLSIVMEWSPGQIGAAGFDLRQFTSDIAALGLRCFALDRHGERPIETGALAAMPYQAGIVMRRFDAA
ncbi:FkbM family methyltransferase [Sphingomonadaceae bacterium G21617-S1]|uniref:FkbM family methyltransferase n=1 Tax=Rhizorhabdus sp. TaxID=1968843 RepID=UPI0019AE533D|nr:FkbM family methyltransferase [Rhizorhabdus sp.]MBD3760646.1 FkbM family methyltransferase [Rhizorhabdus sp.]MCZ4342534.1 FkbM family methyltransferase [Sphingomonadaceae bacterium G21617-S1]